VPRAQKIDLEIARLKYHARLSLSLMALGYLDSVFGDERNGGRYPLLEPRCETDRITSDERTKMMKIILRKGFRRNGGLWV
jgi:hypothetical protein